MERGLYREELRDRWVLLVHCNLVGGNWHYSLLYPYCEGQIWLQSGKSYSFGASEAQRKTEHDLWQMLCSVQAWDKRRVPDFRLGRKLFLCSSSSNAPLVPCVGGGWQGAGGQAGFLVQGQSPGVQSRVEVGVAWLGRRMVQIENHPAHCVWIVFEHQTASVKQQFAYWILYWSKTFIVTNPCFDSKK